MSRDTPLNETTEPIWIIIHKYMAAREMFEKRLQRENSDSPLDFLCLAVTRHGDDNHNFSDIADAINWVENYREIEEGVIDYRFGIILSGDITLTLAPVNVFIMVDPLHLMEGATWEDEILKREEASNVGAILLERPTTSVDDSTIFAGLVNSILMTNAPISVPTPATSPHFSHWKPTLPKTSGAEIYGRQPSHAELPDNNTLEKIFETYFNTDWRELDY